MPGDTLVDWLAEGEQTIDLRTLWASHVSLRLATTGLVILTEIPDHDDGAAIHQGALEKVNDSAMFISLFLGR